MDSTLETTQIDTQVSVAELAEIHAATHPGARLNKRSNDALEAEQPRLTGGIYQRRVSRNGP